MSVAVESTTTSRVSAAQGSVATLVVVCLATFMLLLDATIVAVALPDIQASLSSSLSGLQWVVDAYTLPLAAFLLTAAVVGDRLGRKSVFITGLVVFTVVSAGCALAQNIAALNVLRAAQGCGAAMMMGVTIPLLSHAFPSPRQRARAIGLLAAVTAMATASGPIVGGALVTGLGWQWVFLVNLPIGILCIALAIKFVDSSRAARRVPIDWAGTIVGTTALTLGVLAVIEGNDLGWRSPIIVALGVAAVGSAVAFVALELRVEDPMVDMRLLMHPMFATISLAGFVAFASVTATANFVAIYFMNTLGYTAFEAGLRLLALSVAALLVAPVAAVLQTRVPVHVWLAIAMSFIGAGAFWSSGIAPDDAWLHFLPGLILYGAGIGIVLPITSQVALSFSTDANSGMATGAVSALRQLGTVSGVAVFGAIFASRASDYALGQFAADASNAPPGLDEGRVTAIVDDLGAGVGLQVLGSLPEGLRSAVEPVARNASDQGLSMVFVAAGVLSMVGVFATIALWWRGTFSQPEPIHPRVATNSSESTRSRLAPLEGNPHD